LSKQGKSSCTRLAQCIISKALPAASVISGISSPQALATEKRIVGRILAPPGKTEYSIALLRLSGNLPIEDEEHKFF
jgi:hypothetical protein